MFLVGILLLLLVLISFFCFDAFGSENLKTTAEQQQQQHWRGSSSNAKGKNMQNNQSMANTCKCEEWLLEHVRAYWWKTEPEFSKFSVGLRWSGAQSRLLCREYFVQVLDFPAYLCHADAHHFCAQILRHLCERTMLMQLFSKWFRRLRQEGLVGWLRIWGLSTVGTWSQQFPGAWLQKAHYQGMSSRQYWTSSKQTTENQQQHRDQYPQQQPHSQKAPWWQQQNVRATTIISIVATAAAGCWVKSFATTQRQQHKTRQQRSNTKQ